MEKEKKKNLLIIILIVIIIMLLGIISYFIINKKLDNNHSNEQTSSSTTTKNDYRLIKISDLSYKEYVKYLALVQDNNDINSIYGNKKVNVSSFSEETLLYNVLIYLMINNELEYYYNGTSYCILIDQLTDSVKKIYNYEINKQSLPNFLSGPLSQSMELSLSDTITGIKTYEGFDKIEDIKSLNSVPASNIMYEKMEIVDSNIYLYIKKIMNDDMDWSDTGWGSFTKRDGSGKIEITEENTPSGIINVKDLYKKYPEYFTTYKHTFRKNSDGSILYISTEPID